MVSELRTKIEELLLYGPNTLLRKRLAYSVLNNRFDDIRYEFDRIVDAQAKLSKYRVAAIRYKNSEYQSSYLIGDVAELDESLHTRMDNLLELYKNTDVLVDLTCSFFSLLLEAGKHHKDHLALLPYMLHEQYLHIVDKHSFSRLYAKCWTYELTVSQEFIQLFQHRHRHFIDDIKNYHLNKLLQ